MIDWVFQLLEGGFFVFTVCDEDVVSFCSLFLRIVFLPCWWCGAFVSVTFGDDGFVDDFLATMRVLFLLTE